MLKFQNISTIILKPATEFRYDKRQAGWKVIKNVPLEKQYLNLQFRGITAEKESLKITGYTLMENIKKMGKFAGQLHAELLLDQQRNEFVPREIGDHIILFPGTVWLDPEGDHFIPCLRADNGIRWDLYFFILSHCPFLRKRGYSTISPKAVCVISE